MAPPRPRRDSARSQGRGSATCSASLVTARPTPRPDTGPGRAAPCGEGRGRRWSRPPAVFSPGRRGEARSPSRGAGGHGGAGTTRWRLSWHRLSARSGAVWERRRPGPARASSRPRAPPRRRHPATQRLREPAEAAPFPAAAAAVPGTSPAPGASTAPPLPEPPSLRSRHPPGASPALLAVTASSTLGRTGQAPPFPAQPPEPARCVGSCALAQLPIY